MRLTGRWPPGRRATRLGTNRGAPWSTAAATNSSGSGGHRLNRYLVTGGAGFIGSHVTAELLRRGHRVRVLDNFSTGSRSNLDAVGGDVELVEGDVRSYERTHAATAGIDCVIHLAALPSVPRSVQDPLTTNEVNVTGTLNVVLAARDAGTQRVVMASSSSVYGRAEGLPKTEALVPQPISPYGVSKLAAEQYCMGFNAVYGIEAVALRYFNVFGPRQDPNSQYSGVIPKFLTSALEGEPLVDLRRRHAVARLHLRRQRRRGHAFGQRTATRRPAHLQHRLRRLTHRDVARRDRRTGDGPWRWRSSTSTLALAMCCTPSQTSPLRAMPWATIQRWGSWKGLSGLWSGCLGCRLARDVRVTAGGPF